jgi:hypothetical protein
MLPTIVRTTSTAIVSSLTVRPNDATCSAMIWTPIVDPVAGRGSVNA